LDVLSLSPDQQTLSVFLWSHGVFPPHSYTRGVLLMLGFISGLHFQKILIFPPSRADS
jgi:hypothetical protein